ncbi:MAG: pyrroloquinoline quinone biosynthesis peptide chaperone PqqD [Myxococcales bacterium]
MSPVGDDARPRLARGVRLRLDRITGKTLLLRPEQGFELQGSSLEVVKLCTATLTVAEIVDHLAGGHPDVDRQQIASDVSRLLGELMGRGLITSDTGKPEST